MASINELSIDDFQHIFIHLDYSDLVNLSDCDTYLQNVVKSYLGSMFNNQIVLQCSRSLDFIYFQKTLIRNFQFVLRFIRIFGDQIKILIFWVVDPQKCQIMNDYLNKYCSNLKTLIFRSLKVDFKFGIHNKLENLFFEFCSLSFDSRHLVQFFPCLKRIYIFRLRFGPHMGDIIDFSSFNNCNPSIEVFRLDNWDYYLVERLKFLHC